MIPGFSRVGGGFAAAVFRAAGGRLRALGAGLGFAALLAAGTGCAGLAPRPLFMTAVGGDEQALLDYTAGLDADDRGRPDLAERYYRRALTLTPSSLSVRRSLVGALVRQGKPRQAIVEFQPLLDLPRADGRLLYLLGDLYESLGNTSEAEATYRRILLRDPVHPEPSRALGLLLLRQGRTAEGEAALADALRREPRDREARRALVGLELGRERPFAAESWVRDALAADPEDSEWRLSLARILAGQGREEESAAAYREVLALDPNSLEAREALAQSALNRLDWKEAAVQWEWLFKAEPTKKSVRRNLGLVYLESGRAEEARELILPLVEQGDADGLTHWIMGSLYQRKGHWRLAAQEFGLAARSDPAWAEASLSWAGALTELGDEAQALAALEPGLRAAGKSPALLLRAGMLLLQLKQADRARETLEQAVRLAPAQARIRFQLGRACLEADDFSGAVAAWKEAIRLDPGLADAYNHLGYLHAERGVQLEQAVRWLQKALKLEPKNGNYHDSLGWAFFRQHRYTEALSEFRRAVALMKSQGETVDPEIYDHLGETLQALKRPGEAAEAWKKALQGDPNNLDLRGKLERGRPRLPKPKNR